MTQEREWVVQPWHDEGEGYADEPSTPGLVVAAGSEQAMEEFTRLYGDFRGMYWLEVRSAEECETSREGRRLLRAARDQFASLSTQPQEDSDP